MKELLVTIYVLSIQREYDLSIPISYNMNDALNLIQDSIVNMSNGIYEKKESTRLIDSEGKVINTNKSLLRFSEKSLKIRSLSFFSSSAGFKSIDILYLYLLTSFIWALALRIIGPEIPKWVKIISPKSL